MSRVDLLRALAVVAGPPDDVPQTLVDALELGRAPTPSEHTELFGFQVYPYASVHLGPEGQLGGIARDRVAGFLRALEVVPPPEPDHLAVLLDAAAQLGELEQQGAGDRARHARKVLLHEHLLPWVSRFTDRVGELGAEPYQRWAKLVDGALAAEADELGPVPTLSAHLAEAPGLPDVQEGRDALVTGLLAPVRSGLVIARADLVRAGRELGLGLRIGERAYTLRAMLDQDAPAVFEWLAEEARRQRSRLPEVKGNPIARFWAMRLDTTTRALEDLAADVRERAEQVRHGDV